MNATISELGSRHCRPCEGALPALSNETAHALLARLPGWQMNDQKISKSYKFANHYETMVFVNAIAWVSHCENHHPEVTFGYAECTVRYWTHAIGGLSENDFICAAKLEHMADL